MTTREKVLSLTKQGLCVAEIAERVGVSKQRVYQILAQPVVSKGGRRPARLDHLEAGEPSRKPPLNDEEVERAKDILRQKPEWTWHSAYVAIKEQKMQPAANQVYDLLRELGFEYSRSGRNWKISAK
jgi:transposase